MKCRIIRNRILRSGLKDKLKVRSLAGLKIWRLEINNVGISERKDVKLRKRITEGQNKDYMNYKIAIIQTKTLKAIPIAV